MIKKAKKKRKKRHYHVGLHTSNKLLNGPAKFRSSWEDTYMTWLDNNDDVKSYLYEGIVIGYVGNRTSNKNKHYLPDLLVEMQDGTKHLIEIKPSSKVNQRTNQKKFVAAEIWCKDHDATFEIVTEITMKSLNIEL